MNNLNKVVFKRRTMCSLLKLSAQTILVALGCTTASADNTLDTSMNPLDSLLRDSQQLMLERGGKSAGATMTVRCAGGAYIRNEFNSVAEASFTTFDENGTPIPDGPCKYELVVHPDIDKTLEAKAMLENDDQLLEELARAEQRQTIVLSGAIRIVNGVISEPEVSPDADSDEEHSHDHSQ